MFQKMFEKVLEDDETKIWFCSGLGMGATLAILGLWLVMELVAQAEAATFNTFFNNVEQGANGVSHPKIEISGTNAKKATDDPVAVQTLAVPEVPAAPFPIAPPSSSVQGSPIATSQSAAVTAVQDEESFKRFHFGLSGFSETENHIGSRGAAASLGFHFMRDLGFNFYGGLRENGRGLYGGELEITPIRLGVFGLKNWMEIGARLGASSLHVDPSGGNSWGTAHAGALVAVNLGSRYSVNLGVRTNVTDRQFHPYTMFDGGIQFRF